MLLNKRVFKAILKEASIMVAAVKHLKNQPGSYLDKRKSLTLSPQFS